MKSSNDLRRKLFYFSTAVVLVPMVILYITILAFFTRRSAQENQRYAYHNIQSLSHAVDSALSGLNEISLYIVSSEGVRNYLSESGGRDDSFSEYLRANGSLQFLPFTSKYYTNVTVSADGIEPLMTGGMLVQEPSDEERLAADALSGASFWHLDGGGASLVRLMRDTNRITRSLGYIKIQVDLPELAELLTSPRDMPDTSYLLVTENGVMLQSGELPPGAAEDPALAFASLAGRSADSERLTLAGRSYLCSLRTVNRGKVVLVSLTDEALLYSLDSLLVASIVVAFLLTAFFVYILVRYYTRRVFDPLEQLGEVMTHFDQADFESDFHIPGSNEITRLVDQFNLMCRRINTLHRQIYLSELRLREAELAILQSEINPHFLYNTLDTIYWMSESSRTWKISAMVRSLANLFRIALHKTENGLVALSLEREYMQCYLTIQQVRYQDQFTFEFYVQEDLGEVPVLKLLLQPLVENAIIHGTEPKGHGRIIINIYAEDGELVYKVFNDGDPVDLAEMEALVRQGDTGARRGLAIRNVDARVKLRFGEGYGLSFENPPGGGVLATVRQPLLPVPAPDTEGPHEEEEAG